MFFWNIRDPIHMPEWLSSESDLGVDRLVWGGHGPSRPYATEIGKMLDADISHRGRLNTFGENLRRMCTLIFRKNGLKLEV
ncbi:MAG: hypothetical protein RIQ93_2519 [Verrucomicrobiota bacterium]